MITPPLPVIIRCSAIVFNARQKSSSFSSNTSIIASATLLSAVAAVNHGTNARNDRADDASQSADQSFAAMIDWRGIDTEEVPPH